LTKELGTLKYCSVALFIALRLGWHMIFELDRYDWQYNRGDIWTSFALSVVLWPLMLIKPLNLIDPRKLFEGSFGIAARMRVRDELWINPPPCGSVICYRQEHGYYGETCGEFLFCAADVEQALRRRLEESPNLLKDDEGAILNWLLCRDEALTHPTGVPSAWSRFQYIANVLVRAGSAKVRCLKCGTDLSSEQLVANDDYGMLGWNLDRLACPNGHDLLVVQKYHVYGETVNETIQHSNRKPAMDSLKPGLPHPENKASA